MYKTYSVDAQMPTSTRKPKKSANKRRTKKRQKTANTKSTAIIAHSNSNSNPISNPYKTFGPEIEAYFKKNDIDFLSSTYNVESILLKDLKKAISPSNIVPQNDFYSFINDRWLQSKDKIKESQKYIIQVDNFRLVQDTVYHELLSIVNNHISTTPATQHSTQMKNMYSSLLGFNTNTQSKIYADLMVRQIDSHMSDAPDNTLTVWDLLGFINSIDILSWGAPFVVNFAPDEKQPTVTQCYVSSPKFTLIDLNLYFDDGENVTYKQKYLNKYFKYLDALFENVFGKNHGFNPQDIFDVEVQMLYAVGCEDRKHTNAKDNYNVVFAKNAQSEHGFDWNTLSSALGFKTPPSKFITSNLNYLTCGSKLLLSNWKTAKWRTYWIYLFIRQEQRFNKQGRENHFNFHNKFVNGQQFPMDQNLTPIFGLGYAYNKFLSTEYLKEYRNQQIVDYVNVMAEDLKTIFIRIITRNKWFDPKTKKSALEKLHKLKMQIGTPPALIDDPQLTYDPADSWGNLLKISIWRNKKSMSRVGTTPIDLPEIDWSVDPVKFIGTQSYVVNASYTANENKIYVPAGYLQPPFVDLNERGIEYNLAQIGFTLGHEMSHALDDWGSTYDANGVLHNWWTNADRAKFAKIQKEIGSQYTAFAKQDGIDFDPELSMGENLADISGLTICREYLRDFQIKSKTILPIQKISFEAFFIYYAHQQRQHINEKALVAQLKTNPHPLDKYRTNIPLSRLPIFRTMYDIKKGDKMWWPSTSRVWE
jgi:putative endopeptidase